MDHSAFWHWSATSRHLCIFKKLIRNASLAVKVQASARSFVSINSNYNLCSRLQAVFSFSSVIVDENEQASEWVSCINAAGNLQLATLAAWHARHVSTTRVILAPVRLFVSLDYPWTERETARSLHWQTQAPPERRRVAVESEYEFSRVRATTQVHPTRRV